ncbi:MAG: DUF6197 family protein [Janthinobacterium lividum]
MPFDGFLTTTPIPLEVKRGWLARFFGTPSVRAISVSAMPEFPKVVGLYRKTEVDILNEMTATLGQPGSWCKDVLFTGSGARSSPKSGQHCVYGALNLADHGHADWFGKNPGTFQTKAAISVQDEMKKTIKLRGFRKNDLADYNNSPETAHEDILDVIAEVKFKFETC